jgi:hypothetical protein
MGFTWKNADMNMTVLIRKYGVHAVRVVYSRHKSLPFVDFTSSVCCLQDRLPARRRVSLVVGLPP